MYPCHRAILNPEFLDRKPTPVLVLFFCTFWIKPGDLDFDSLLPRWPQQNFFFPTKADQTVAQSLLLAPSFKPNSVCCTLKKEKLFYSPHQPRLWCNVMGSNWILFFLFDHLFPLSLLAGRTHEYSNGTTTESEVCVSFFL